MIKDSKLRWISSAGGPLVLLQSSSLSAWQGVHGEDYERAGAITGHTGIITKAGRDVLVLWGEPLETTYHEAGTRQFLTQWSYAPDEESVIKALSELDGETVEPLGETSMSIMDPEQFLIDAGAPGTGVRERLTLSLVPGHYVVRTFAYRPSTDVELIMHEMLRG